MDDFIYLEYPDKIVKFDIWKNYGIDKNLMLGEKPIPIKTSTKDIVLDYNFLLELLPLEIWLKIFEILHREALITYKSSVSCELEYNMHRLFKQKEHIEVYRGFLMKIRASPGLFQFYSNAYNQKDIKEYYGYTSQICHHSLNQIEQLSDYVPRYNKCKTVRGGLFQEDCWGLILTTDHKKDFVFTEGFNPENIVRRLKLHQKNGNIKTFKTMEYCLQELKRLIDNFYSGKDRIRNIYFY